jgi:hypothetical protein
MRNCAYSALFSESYFSPTQRLKDSINLCPDRNPAWPDSGTTEEKYGTEHRLLI